ncbi:hypothetical protein BDZ97DRAFT_1803556 [Flammula alnicola]|nr:hypothetical protein BDZ97DRAFT_1803556 [Flammula alnicola]
MARELDGQWVGPMPIHDFMEQFLPETDETLEARPAFSDVHFQDMDVYKKETEMYGPFIALVNAAGVLGNDKLIDTSKWPDPDSEPGLQGTPDISQYDRGVDTTTNHVRFQEAQMLWELEAPNNTYDPFEDPREKFSSDEARNTFLFEAPAVDRSRCRGQIAYYGTVWCARQYRLHCFLVWLGDPYVRFIRLDREGGIVSRRFNFRMHGSVLREFLWRFSHLTPTQRGWDPTVHLATPEEEALAREKLAEWAPTKERQVFKIDIPGDGSVHQVLAWGPIAQPLHSLTGRATKGYPVWDLSTNQLAFLKDSWRAVGPDLEKESDILRTLNEHHVRNVPTILYGDDLEGPEQITLTQQYAMEQWNLGANPDDLCLRRHARFAMDFIGRHLQTFTSSKQFLKAVFDAFIAHQDAYERCSILHRDVSGNNVLLTRDGTGGVLNDWDLARTVNKTENGPRQPSRSGTWQFMSINILRRADSVHTLQDDLESFFYVVLYFTLRYLKHTKTAVVSEILKRIFDQHLEYENSSATGGDGKCALIAFKRHRKRFRCDWQ